MDYSLFKRFSAIISLDLASNFKAVASPGHLGISYGTDKETETNLRAVQNKSSVSARTQSITDYKEENELIALVLLLATEQHDLPGNTLHRSPLHLTYFLPDPKYLMHSRNEVNN